MHSQLRLVSSTGGLRSDWIVMRSRPSPKTRVNQLKFLDAIYHLSYQIGMINLFSEVLLEKNYIVKRNIVFCNILIWLQGTTVSATCIAANSAGIRIFCTGGIGGVHRDFQDTMDVSADLFELGRTPLAVVCSGVKSILDVGKTLEYLETLGVYVHTYTNYKYKIHI